VRARDVDVVAARSPVQRALPVGLIAPVVRVGAPPDQQRNDFGAARGVARPVRHEVQQPSPAIAGNRPANQLRPSVQRGCQRGEITHSECDNQRIDLGIPRLAGDLLHGAHQPVGDGDQRCGPLVAAQPGHQERGLIQSGHLCLTRDTLRPLVLPLTEQPHHIVPVQTVPGPWLDSRQRHARGQHSLERIQITPGPGLEPRLAHRA
jgi:hypothetical protein